MAVRRLTYLTILALAAACSGTPDGDGAAGASCPVDAKPANMSFTLKSLNGENVRLADYKGKIVFLNFWATWCVPCKAEIPILVDYNFPYGVLLGIDDSTLVRYTVVPGKFEDWGGSVLLPSASTHVATGLFYIYDNFFLDAPNKCIRFDGIDVNVTNIHVE